MNDLTEARKPPVATTGILGWLRINLFSNWVNSLISLGVESDILIPVSLGELPLQKASMGRSVMLNVLISSEQ